MNKQQLASKIWESANKMRSKIEANEYKDYILGFIFYKFLSEKEIRYLKDIDWTDEYLPELKESETETVENIKSNIGYFISYDNLFSTWIKKGSDFDVSNVRDALNAFTRHIHKDSKKVFDGIFDTLNTGLSKLGAGSKEQTKAVSDLLHLIKDIPMDDKQDYDVLGFVYEYLISNFAANAGKKAGEFYTPFEVSKLMSDIVAEHLKDREEIKIYDSCSGSGSLLINIGKSASKYLNSKDSIKYYAQELKQNTYNLTRMNLIMRGILPANIAVRNGDTLEDDWPYFDETNPIDTYDPLYVDAVVGNPPYSQKWNPSGKKTDPRYSEYGLAPKSKADYAFLLHDLYHVKPDGIMTIVLPHGVLFRGGEEGTIRENLINKNKIDAIIGLPANIFFGTGIPTIVMVLKQKRDNTDILIIDASKGFVKVGKNNKLRDCDIKRITDAVKDRKDIDKFCKVVSREEVIKNEYNLNIPRYVDSSDKGESWDIYASMFGGIPKKEINDFDSYWKAFPSLKDELFKSVNEDYCALKTADIKSAVKRNADVVGFVSDYKESFNGFDESLKAQLIEGVSRVNITKKEEEIGHDIFSRLSNLSLVNKYEAYQLFSDDWKNVSIDLEMIQTEGLSATKQVDPNMVIKKKDGKEEEVQDGWVGHIIPFELVQQLYLSDDLLDLKINESRLLEINSEYEELIDALSEDDKQKLLNDDNTSFVSKEVGNAYKEVLEDISTPESEVLKQYLEIYKTNDKLEFAKKHQEIDWNKMALSKNGTFGKKEVTQYMNLLKSSVKFEDGSYENIVVRVNTLLAEEKELKKGVKEKSENLHTKTKDTIENLSEEQVNELLKEKWITPLIQSLMKLPDSIVNEMTSKLEALSKKYETTFAEVESQISKIEKELIKSIDDLEGNEFDMKGLNEFKTILEGKENDQKRKK